MKKIWAVTLIALAAACSDRGWTPLENTEANLAISDGANGGNPHFFFLSPLVPDPASFPGSFNPNLEPFLEVHLLLDPLDTRCAPTSTPITITSFDTAPTWYGLGFPTGQHNLTDGQVYRICFKVPGFELGYRDVRPNAPGTTLPSDPELAAVYDFINGDILPVRARVENGALCALNAIDCTETILGPAGGTAVCDNEFCGLQIQPQAISQNFLFIVQLLECPTTPDGRVRFINADIPQFPGCMDITIEPADQFTGLAIPGLAGACLGTTGLTEEQEERIQLHHEQSDGTVEALPNVPAPFVNCANFVAMQRGVSPLGMLARRMWRGVQTIASPWFAPRGVEAIDRGLGGEGFDFGSPFVWALPSQMEQVGWNNPEPGRVGDVVNPTVLVTDAGGDPVENATITFDVQLGSGPPFAPVQVLTDATGLASVPWTLNPAGPLLLEASGRGIGVAAGADGRHIGNSPPGGFGVFADHVMSVVDLGTGILDFDAVACDVTGDPVVDGAVSAGEYANSAQFTANLAGGAVPATVYWTNGCDDLFMAVTVEGDAALRTSLRVIFDNDGDGLPALGDDVLVLERNAQDHVFADHFLPANCLNSTQSSCTEPDPGAPDGSSVVLFDGGANLSIFELSHPLMTGDGGHDFQLDFGHAAGFFLAFLRGEGHQGNSEFPGYRVYQQFNIVFP